MSTLLSHQRAAPPPRARIESMPQCTQNALPGTHKRKYRNRGASEAPHACKVTQHRSALVSSHTPNGFVSHRMASVRRRLFLASSSSSSSLPRVESAHPIPSSSRACLSEHATRQWATCDLPELSCAAGSLAASASLPASQPCHPPPCFRLPLRLPPPAPAAAKACHQLQPLRWLSLSPLPPQRLLTLRLLAAAAAGCNRPTAP